MLWEALKATMRGYIISFETYRKREKIKRRKEIEKEITQTEQIHQTSLLQSDYNKILGLKSEYNSLMGSEIQNLLLKTRQKHFELNDKPYKLLSRQLKGEQAKSAIHKIQSKNGQILTDQKDINQCFREFYSDLHTSTSTATKRDYFQFFDSLNLPQLNDRNQKFLERDFSVDELNEAIKAFLTGKCPGPDGLGACSCYSIRCPESI